MANRLKHRPDLLGDAEPPEGKKVIGKGLLPPGAALDLQRVLVFFKSSSLKNQGVRVVLWFRARILSR